MYVLSVAPDDIDLNAVGAMVAANLADIASGALVATVSRDLAPRVIHGANEPRATFATRRAAMVGRVQVKRW